MILRTLVFGSILCGALLLAQSRRAVVVDIPQNNPFTSAADLEAGRKLYIGRCGHCHGQAGEGGRGAVLNSGQLRHGGSDRELFSIIRNGIPNTEMPGTFSMPEPEVWRIVAHVKQLGQRGSSDPATGNATAGALVYRKNGCTSCHTIENEGGFLGPDLTSYGSTSSVEAMRREIVRSPRVPIQGYRTASLVTVNGDRLEGTIRNEDNFSVQLQTKDGGFHLFKRSDLQSFEYTGGSLMPTNYRQRLSDEELNDLIAYLMTTSRKQKTTPVVKKEEDE